MSVTLNDILGRVDKETYMSGDFYPTSHTISMDPQAKIKTTITGRIAPQMSSTPKMGTVTLGGGVMGFSNAEEIEEKEPPVQIIERWELKVGDIKIVLKNTTKELIQTLTKILTKGPEEIPEDIDNDEL